MFDEILNNIELFALRREACEENDIGVELSNNLTENKYIILKIDDFYNSLKISEPPPSIDCLIIVKCDSNQCYDFYLVELKNIKSPSGFTIKNIQQKFTTTIDDFLGKRFAQIFLNPKYHINNFKIYFISDPYNLKHLTPEQYRKRILTSKYKLSLLRKPYSFRGKISMINSVLPNPMIKEC